MVYNTENAREVTPHGKFPKDTILDGIIVRITDGQVKDFAKNWKNPEQPAIQVHYECGTGENIIQDDTIFTYLMGEDKVVEYTMKSNIGKYKVKYGHLPTVQDKIKVITNSDGYGQIKLD